MDPRHLALAASCVALLSAACGDLAPRSGEPPPPGETLFTRLPSSYTGVTFENRVEDRADFNVFTYRNFYNGGGVALADLTGDGLPEIFFTSNLEENRLYLNEGGFRFRDVTDEAGVEGEGAWATGATFADVNGDGRLDLWVGYAGDVEPEERRNELYLHRGVGEDGIPFFEEAASDLGLDDAGWATHAAFFDYDRDGDLDHYLVNNSSRPANSFGTLNTRDVRHPAGGDRLYRNDGGRFTDVSEEAGIFGSEIGFGLGLAVSDLDRDGWPDLYISNDFFERDYLYRNRGDGTFAESIVERMPAISYSSMGLDTGDIDNDGYPDVYVTDMLPEDEYRYKMTQGFESWDVYRRRIENDFHHQFTRNTLQLNRRVGVFSEIGFLAGVARTDWSWSALVADFDLDGFKDIHVTNGLLRDVTSQDYIAFLGNPRTMETARQGEGVDFLALIAQMTSTPLANDAFRNRGDLTFADVGEAWGLADEGFSHGAAYGDLDGDGALDLVVSDVNGEALLYRNDALVLTDHGFVRIRLEGEGANRFGVGAKVTLRTGDRLFYQELVPSRGFQSSVDYTLTFGVGTADTVASVTVEWPDGRVSVQRDVPAGSTLTVRQDGAVAPEAGEEVAGEPAGVAGPAGPDGRDRPAALLVEVGLEIGLTLEHRENPFVDFHRERMIPKLLSREGPTVAVGDVNGDGLEDAYLGGAKEQAGRLLIQRRDGSFTPSDREAFRAHSLSEDLGAAFFDADGDGDLDLYVVSGGSEFSDRVPALEDRFYRNDGRGDFRHAPDALPPMNASGSTVAPHDIDGDGDLDLFVGGRVVPWRYGLDPASSLLENDGSGTFTDVTARLAPELASAGMVTDAVWEDVDGDGRADLVVVGEWMPIRVFRSAGAGRLEPLEVPGLERSGGWWNRIAAADLTGDGLTDFVLGNLGLNTPLRASETEPLVMYVKDFDRNGFAEQIIARPNEGAGYPLALRDDLLGALPYLRSRYPDFESYALQTVTDIFSSEELADAVVRRAHTLSTALARNEGGGSFTLVPLPLEAQFAPVYGVHVDDLDRDGRADLLLAGNFDGFEPELGRARASYGLALRGDGSGGFEPLSIEESGFFVPGEARDIARLETPRGPVWIVARNDDRPLAFRRAGGEAR